MYFVYIIYSPSFDTFYKGYSTIPRNRVVQHNNSECRYTSKTNDQKLKHIEKYKDKTTALKREKSLKKYSKAQIIALIDSEKNQLENLD